MRVLEPHHFRAKKKKRHGAKAFLLFVGVLLVAGVGLLAYWATSDMRADRQRQRAESAAVVPVSVPKAEQKMPIQLKGNEFRDLYREVMRSYPNTQEFPAPPSITGNIDADDAIRTIAESRGFQLTRIPVAALIKTNEPRLKGQSDDLLQPQAYQAWLDIKAAAKKDDIPLVLNSAYRAPDWQRELFVERFMANGGSPASAAAGTADSVINTTLGMTSIPGYSRHHTGYTVDFWCEDGSGVFGQSMCHDWLVKDDYLIPKTHGWIPSYPEGADEQGPEPEPWEYVWVGRDVLFK